MFKPQGKSTFSISLKAGSPILPSCPCFQHSIMRITTASSLLYCMKIQKKCINTLECFETIYKHEYTTCHFSKHISLLYALQEQYNAAK